MTDNTKYSQWAVLYSRNRAKHPEWRVGQCAFNSLWLVDELLANEIRATDLDPFYKEGEGVISYFSNWLWCRYHPG